MIWYITLFITLVFSVFIIQSWSNNKIKYNPYQKILSWNYDTIWTTTGSSNCLTWKIIDIWIIQWTWQYIYYPDKTWNDNTYNDWINNINKNDCMKELKNDYTWHFNAYKIQNNWIRMSDWNNNLILWKYIFK